MSNIVIHDLAVDLSQRLELRAARHGHSIEAEIKAILQTVLTTESPTQIDLATAIERRFAHLDAIEIPEIIREPIRTPPDFGTMAV